MSQILLWTSFLEIFGGIACFATIQGRREPGDFQFDPLGLSQVLDAKPCFFFFGVGVLEEEMTAVQWRGPNTSCPAKE
jgi:hypothetical protein